MRRFVTKLRKKILSYKRLIYRVLLKMIKVFLKKFKKSVDV